MCIISVVDITPPPAQPISLRLDNVLPRHVQLIGPQVCTQTFATSANELVSLVSE